MEKTNERRIRLWRIDFNRGWKPLPHELKSKFHISGDRWLKVSQSEHKKKLKAFTAEFAEKEHFR